MQDKLDESERSKAVLLDKFSHMQDQYRQSAHNLHEMMEKFKACEQNHATQEFRMTALASHVAAEEAARRELSGELFMYKTIVEKQLSEACKALSIALKYLEPFQKAKFGPMRTPQWCQRMVEEEEGSQV